MNRRYALEKDCIGIPTYYIARTKWTTELASATLFKTVKAAEEEITLLPDESTCFIAGKETNITIRTIILTPDKAVK